MNEINLAPKNQIVRKKNEGEEIIILKKLLSLKEAFHNAFKYFKNQFDPVYGGFEGPQKYLMPCSLNFLLEYYLHYGDKDALYIVSKTLNEISQSGIWDKEHGGFFRFARDRKWQVPYYEKNLSDQALMAEVYLKAFGVTGNLSYLNIAKYTIRYVLNHLKNKNGGFYSGGYYPVYGPECREGIKKRVHKIVSLDWNALMISPLVSFYKITGEIYYYEQAKNIYNFIFGYYVTDDGYLIHCRYPSHVTGLLDDYSYTIKSMIDLYTANKESIFIDKSIQLIDQMNHLFWDEKKGGYFFTPQNNMDVYFPQKDIYDGTLPSGNSYALFCLIHLSNLTKDIHCYLKAEKLAGFFYEDITNAPHFYPQFLCSLYFFYDLYFPDNEC